MEVTAGNVHDSVIFDTVYDRVTKRFPEVEVVVADAGYKTPWIFGRTIWNDRRMCGIRRWVKKHMREKPDD